MRRKWQRAAAICLLGAWSLFFCPQALAQEPEPEEGGQEEGTQEETPRLGLREAPAPVAPKKQRVKKNIFYGIKVKKTRKSTYVNAGKIRETFYRLKEDHPRPAYVPYVYWYHQQEKKIIRSLRHDPAQGMLLHGLYQKKLDKAVIEEGYFYLGVRHGRWIKLNRRGILVDKKYYYKGWPEQAKFTYYSAEKKHLREIIPFQYGKKEGTYYAFYKNQQIAAKGRYTFDQKVGEWIAYYVNKQPKRIIQYPKTPFEESFKPFISKEWSPNGTLIYDSTTMKNLIH